MLSQGGWRGVQNLFLGPFAVKQESGVGSFTFSEDGLQIGLEGNAAARAQVQRWRRPSGQHVVRAGDRLQQRRSWTDRRVQRGQSGRIGYEIAYRGKGRGGTRNHSYPRSSSRVGDKGVTALGEMGSWAGEV